MNFHVVCYLSYLLHDVTTPKSLHISVPTGAQPWNDKKSISLQVSISNVAADGTFFDGFFCPTRYSNFLRNAVNCGRIFPESLSREIITPDRSVFPDIIKYV